MRKEFHIIENDLKRDELSYMTWLWEESALAAGVRRILKQKMTNDRTVKAIRKLFADDASPTQAIKDKPE